MGDSYGRSTTRRVVESGLHHLFGLRVESGSSFVKKQDLRIPEKRPGNRDTLLLTARQLRSFATDLSVKARGKRLDEFQNIRIAASLLQFQLGHLRLGLGGAEKDIEADRPSVQGLNRMSMAKQNQYRSATYRFLGDQCQVLAILLDVERRNILSVQEHSASQWVVEPLQ